MQLNTAMLLVSKLQRLLTVSFSDDPAVTTVKIVLIVFGLGGIIVAFIVIAAVVWVRIYYNRGEEL